MLTNKATHTHTYQHVYMHTHTHMCAHAHAHTCTHTHIHMCTHAHHARTHTHTYIHTHKDAQPQACQGCELNLNVLLSRIYLSMALEMKSHTLPVKMKTAKMLHCLRRLEISKESMNRNVTTCTTHTCLKHPGYSTNLCS